jgi:hypothetical protein
MIHPKEIAYEPSQKYKEGKYILEMMLLKEMEED